MRTNIVDFSELLPSSMAASEFCLHQYAAMATWVENPEPFSNPHSAGRAEEAKGSKIAKLCGGLVSILNASQHCVGYPIPVCCRGLAP
jgi:hypothetical protein